MGCLLHYNDVMSEIASQITSLTIVYSIIYSDADQRKHQSSASRAFVWGIHRGPVNSLHKWPVTWKMFPFHDVILVSILKENNGAIKRLDWIMPELHLFLVLYPSTPLSLPLSLDTVYSKQIPYRLTEDWHTMRLNGLKTDIIPFPINPLTTWQSFLKHVISFPDIVPYNCNISEWNLIYYNEHQVSTVDTDGLVL